MRAPLRGVIGKIVALAVIPIVAISVLNVYGTTQTLSLFVNTLDSRDASDEMSDAVARANAKLTNNLVVLLDGLNTMVQAHQYSLLEEDSDAVEDTLALREEVETRIADFLLSVGELAAVVEEADLLPPIDAEFDANTATESETRAFQARQLLGVLERSAANMSRLFSTYVGDNDMTIELIREEDFGEASLAFVYVESEGVAAINGAITRVADNLDNLSVLVGSLMQESRQADAATAVEQLQASARQAYAILAVFAVMLTVGAIWYATQFFAKPLCRMADNMGVLSRGQTDISVPAAGDDEIGRMAEALGVFRDNLIEKIRLTEERELMEKQAEDQRRADMATLASTFEARVMDIVESVGTASTDVRTAAENLSTTAEETSQQSGAVASASSAASENVQTVAAATEELSANISEIRRQVEQSSDIAQQAVGESEEMNDQVQGLNQGAQKIGDVVSLISEIADQTNLLALNATIEAARAGDAGKGFAVVASEVKGLANQTAKATEDISAQVAEMQDATNAAVTAIGKIGDRIAQIAEIAAAISNAVEEQSAATGEIAGNVQSAARGTEEVNSNIGGVEAAAGATGRSAVQLLDASGELAQVSDSLKLEVETFLTEVRSA